MRPTGISMATKGVLCPVAVDVAYGGGGGPAGAAIRDDEELAKPRIIVTNMRISEERNRVSDDNVVVTGVKIIVD